MKKFILLLILSIFLFYPSTMEAKKVDKKPVLQKQTVEVKKPLEVKNIEIKKDVEVKKHNFEFKELNKKIDKVNDRVNRNMTFEEHKLYNMLPVKLAKDNGLGEEVGLTIVKECNRYKLDQRLVMGMIEIESGWYNHGPNECGATGLMQITPNTGASLASDLNMGDYDLMNPIDNVKLGTYYIYCLLLKYGNYHSALTAYNRGEGGYEDYISYTGTPVSEYSEAVLSAYSMG